MKNKPSRQEELERISYDILKDHFEDVSPIVLSKIDKKIRKALSQERNSLIEEVEKVENIFKGMTMAKKQYHAAESMKYLILTTLKQK